MSIGIFDRQFQDHFDNGTVDLTYDVGGTSSITESASIITLNCAAGNNWYLFSNNYAPRVYESFSLASGEVRMYQCRMVYADAYASTFMGLAAGNFSTNPRSYRFGFKPAEIYLESVSFGSSTFLANVTSVSAPNATSGAHIYRIYYNFNSTPAVLQDGITLKNGHAAFYYSTNNGDTFTFLYSEANSISNDLNNGGLFAISTAGFACTAKFEYLERYKVNYNIQTLPSTPSVVNRMPAPNSLDVDRNAPIKFSLVDDGYLYYNNSGIDLSTTNIYVRGVQVYNGSVFSSGWTNSTVSYNGIDENGYSFNIVPDEIYKWGSNETVTVQVIASDQEPIVNTLNTSWTFNSNKLTNLGYFPSTTFPDTTLVKGWAPHRLSLPPWGSDGYSFLNPGIRINTTGAFLGDDTTRTIGTWSGLVASGWGFNSTLPQCNIELEWNALSLESAASTYRYGIALTTHRRIIDYASIDGASNWVFVGVLANYPGAGTHTYVIEKFDPMSGALGTITTVASSGSVALPTSGKIRLVRTGVSTFEGYYYTSSWNLIGSFTDTSVFKYNRMSPAIFTKRSTGGSSGLTWDISRFKLNSGVPTPSSVYDVISESFDDGYVGNPLKWSGLYKTQSGGDTPIVYESSSNNDGYLNFNLTTASSVYSHGYLSNFALFPGTDIEIGIDVELRSYIAARNQSIGVLLQNQTLDDQLNKYVGVVIRENSGSDLIDAKLIYAFNGAETTAATLNLGANVPNRITLKLKRTGNTWDAYAKLPTFTETWRDEFSDGYIDFSYSKPVVTSTIADTGSVLRITVPSGTSCDWWSGATEYAPIAYWNIPSGRFRAIANLTSFTASGGESVAGITLWDDRDNAYILGYNYGNSKFVAEKIINNTGSTDFTEPSTTVLTASTLLGMEYDPDTRTIVCWRALDGISWAKVYTYHVLNFLPDRFGTFLKNYGGLPSATADFGYVSFNSYLSDAYQSIGSITDSVGYTVNSPLTIDLLQRDQGDQRIYNLYVSGDYQLGDFEDLTPPTLRNKNPDAYSGQVSKNLSLITVDIVDPGSAALQRSSIDAYVDNVNVYNGLTNTFFAPWNGPSSTITQTTVDGYDGYHLILNYTGSQFSSYKNILFRVRAYDDVNNVYDNTYSFRIEDYEAPIFGTTSPISGSTNVNQNITITIPMYDKGSGINKNTIDAYVNNTLVYDGATDTFYSPYDGISSSLDDAVIDGYDGYMLTIDLNGQYQSNQFVSITVNATDYEGN